MFDAYGRNIHYLRLSVTDLCNLRCRYCMPDGVPKLAHEDILTYEEFLRLAALFAQCGIDTVRITGGEPLVRRGVEQLTAGLKAIPGIRRVALTTNGVLLAQKLPALLAAGLDSFIKVKIMSETKLSHFDASGSAVMVDVSEKPVTARQAVARGIITMNAAAFAAVRDGTAQKGDVLGVARIAGIMAAKRTSELIPLCHPLPLSKLTVDFHLLPEQQAVEAVCTARTIGVTGVEMEALTGVSAALLTIYDMCKAVDKGMELGEIHLVEKTGGKSGHYVRAEGGYV